MGPPFENGGGAATAAIASLWTTKLQWGRRSKTAEGCRGATGIPRGLRRGFNGAAVRKRRRESKYEHNLRVVVQASMGPPFENGGGCVILQTSLHFANAASMGPPFENGGGFLACAVQDRDPLASMGPPFENGGGEQAKQATAEAEQLQWGRRSKTAEGWHAFASLQTRAMASLQWGRRSKTAEGAIYVNEVEDVYILASMGPPFENGGGHRIQCVAESKDPLQWGRRSKTAEGGMLIRTSVRDMRRLQWGRRSKTAEGRASRGAAGRVPGAASMGPPFENGGGMAAHVDEMKGSNLLQWGRRSKTAEGMQDGSSECESSQKASMGPPFENGGGVMMSPAGACSCLSFNGAAVRKRRRGPTVRHGARVTWRGFNGAAVRKRRRGSSTDLTSARCALQWGRRSKTAEGIGRCTTRARQSELQWGRRSKTAEGRAGWGGCHDAVHAASMGPPFENGGGPAGVPAILSVKANCASMGPPFENGGGSKRRPRPGGSRSRFNGAAVRKRRRASH